MLQDCKNPEISKKCARIYNVYILKCCLLQMYSMCIYAKSRNPNVQYVRIGGLITGGPAGAAVSRRNP